MKRNKKIALLFPGQGSQYKGMGKQLYHESADARRIFELASATLGYDLKEACFNDPDMKLDLTEICQPAILTVSYAFFEAYKNEFRIMPFFSAGNSLGEITALTCAGTIDFIEAVKLVRNRGKYMQETVTESEGAMYAVTGAKKDEVENECLNYSSGEKIAVISNYNAPGQFVISGHSDAVNKVQENLVKKGAISIKLKVSAPFHSPLMKKAAEKLNADLKKIVFKEPVFEIISNVSGRPYASASEIVDNLTNQMTKPVRWDDTINFLKSKNMDMFIEMGPNTILRNIMLKYHKEVRSFSYDVPTDKTEISKIFSLGSGNTTEHKKISNSDFIIRCISAAISVKNNNWNNAEYQKGVIDPYRKITEMLDNLQGNDPAKEHVKEAFKMLLSVLETKKMPKIERSQIIEETVSGFDTEKLDL